MSESLYLRLGRRYGGLESTPATRRDVLKFTLASAAGLLLSGPALGFVAPRRPRASAKRVVVIGGGFAGLTCAHELKSIGYDVTVVEARNRVGGRVLSFGEFIAGKNVEGGGELIGSNHPAWVSYAQKFGLEFLDVTEDKDAIAPIRLEGKVLEEKECNELWEALEGATATMTADAAKVDADAAWNSPGAADFDKKSVQQWIDAQEAPALLKRALHLQFSADNGVEAEHQSYLGMLASIAGGGGEKYWTDSEVYRCKGGNQQLATKLAEAIGADRIIMKLPATRVTRKRDANSNGGGESIVVECADGRTIACDDLVVAVPPSVWKSIAFDPALPATLKPQMGTNVKYLSKVKSRFWKEKGLGPDSMTDGISSMTWDGTDNQLEEGAASLTSFSGGAAAEKCMAIDRDKINAAYGKDLEEVYPGFKDQFLDGRFMAWPAERWTGGGYSFPAPGEVTTVGPALRAGIDNRIHFAGEHCCYAFVGYMEGALNSGAGLAKRLALRDGLLKKESTSESDAPKPAPKKDREPAPLGAPVG